MTRIPKFGFSAFLRIICANEKPQKRLIKERHKPSEGGYDFHKSLRRLIQKLTVGELTTPNDIAMYVAGITQAAERKSVSKGIKTFREWYEKNAMPLRGVGPMVFSSPNNHYQVNFTADFITEIDGRNTAVHVWNTNSNLNRNLVIATLTIVAKSWPVTQTRPSDYAVLSLKTGDLLKWSDASAEHKMLGERLMLHIERLCVLARKELGLPAIYPSKESPGPEPK